MSLPGDIGRSVRRWFDNGGFEAGDDRDARSAGVAEGTAGALEVDWLRLAPFVLLHLGCFAIPWVGISAVAVWTAVSLYALRMFAVTAFYHRYFSHRSFRAGRGAQLCFALLGASAVQRGPLWWAGHHRLHHRSSDREGDAHSPRRDGLLWSHMGWFAARRHFHTPMHAVQDLARFPELRFLDRYDTLVPLALALALYLAGELLARLAPGLGTSGPQLLVWGFCVSTVVLLHATFTINSLAHRFGSRRFDTPDDSRNNALLALLTFGEGWHNNHHHYPSSVRQGFRWWELDLTWYGLRLLAALGVIRDLRPVPVELVRPSRSPIPVDGPGAGR